MCKEVYKKVCIRWSLVLLMYCKNQDLAAPELIITRILIIYLHLIMFWFAQCIVNNKQFSEFFSWCVKTMLAGLPQISLCWILTLEDGGEIIACKYNFSNEIEYYWDPSQQQPLSINGHCYHRYRPTILYPSQITVTWH